MEWESHTRETQLFDKISFSDANWIEYQTVDMVHAQVNLTAYMSKKQNVVERPSSKAEHRVMANNMCIMWIKNIMNWKGHS